MGNDHQCRLCFLDQSCIEIEAAAVDVVDIDDLSTKGHPNVMKFSGTLLRVDSASDKPPQGAMGHRIYVARATAERLLDTLPGMAVNFKLDGHQPQVKIGVITSAWIDKSKVNVKGFIWAKDFPDEAEAIKANSKDLGMSMELADVWVEDKDADVWKLEDFKFTGAAILAKKAAAYHRTALAALAASAEVVAEALGIGMKQDGRTGRLEVSAQAEATQGEKTMGDVKKKAAVAAQSATRGQELIKAMAAAFGTALKPVKDALDAQTAKLEELLEARRGDPSDPSADPSDVSSQADEVTAEGEVEEEIVAEEGEEVDAAGKRMTDPSVDPSDPSDPSDMSSKAATKSVKAKKKADASDDGDDTSSEDDDDLYSFDSGDPHGGTENADSEPGKQNKNAMDKYKKNSTAHLHAAAERRYLGRLNAQAEKIQDLERKLERSANKVEMMQAQIERHSEEVSRKSVAPVTLNLLSKQGVDVTELYSNGQKLTVGRVDEILANCGVTLGPTERARLKNELVQANLMEDGLVRQQ